MRSMFLLAPVAALALSACGDSAESGSSGETISVEDVADRARSAPQPEPGQYRVSMEVLEVDIPGAPPQAADMMRSMIGGQTHEYCLKPEDVEKGYQEMVRQSQEGSDCSFEKFDVSGGDIDARMTCSAAGQGAMTMAMTGSATPTRSEMDMTMSGNMAGMGDSTIRMKATHERIGDCG